MSGRFPEAEGEVLAIRRDTPVRVDNGTAAISSSCPSPHGWCNMLSEVQYHDLNSDVS